MGYFYLHTSSSEAKNFSARRTVEWAIATFVHQLLWSILFRRARRGIESLRETESGSPWWSRWLTGWSGWKRRRGGIPSWMKYFRFPIISHPQSFLNWLGSRYQNLCLSDLQESKFRKKTELMGAWTAQSLERSSRKSMKCMRWEKNLLRNNSNCLLFKNVNWTNKINNHCQSLE